MFQKLEKTDEKDSNQWSLDQWNFVNFGSEANCQRGQNVFFYLLFNLFKWLMNIAYEYVIKLDDDDGGDKYKM